MNNFVQKLGAIALSGVLLTAAVPKRAEATTAVLLPAGAVAATLVVVGGITLWLVTYANGEQLYFNYEDLLPMQEGEYLENPEGTSETWTDYIWANSPSQAEARCREYARNAGVIYVNYRRTSRSGSRYECTFRSYNN